MAEMTVSLEGRRAVVTGATRGIGREVAVRLARAGCDVGITGRADDELASLRAEIERLGRRCWTRAADLASRGQTLAMAEYFAGAMDPLDILVNNAGVAITERLLDLDPEHWDTVLKVNLTAPALVSKVIAAGMARRRSGAIVNVSSQAGVIGLAEHAAYCASKFGLNGLTKVMAIELGPHNVRVNAVAPTVVLTPMGEQVWGDPEKGGPMKARIPLGRFAYPSNIADAVLFLASDAASMIHGEVLLIDGGYTAQ
jgi:NAD(P)-dependent dehydrogenase (short-subunit alcohol dehydrogenase family)